MTKCSKCGKEITGLIVRKGNGIFLCSTCGDVVFTVSDNVPFTGTEKIQQNTFDPVHRVIPKLREDERTGWL